MSGSKVRIAILQNGLIRGGTERFVINLCKGLMGESDDHDAGADRAECLDRARSDGNGGQSERAGVDITVINPSLRPEEQVLEPEVLATSARIEHTATLVGFSGRIRHLWRLYRLLRRGYYDVFHTNLDLFNGPNLMVAWLARVPIRICHAHASMQETELRAMQEIMQRDNRSSSLPGLCANIVHHLRLGAIRCYQRLMRWMCWHFANRHIGCSELANDFLYRGRDWRITAYPTVIYNGIDLAKYKTPAETDYRFEPGVQYILAVGRFVPQKNPEFILDIMQKLKELRPEVRLLWVGKGPLFETVCGEAARRGLCDELSVETAPECPDGNIQFLGWRDDVTALMQRTRLLLMPSHFEGLSITLIEAQAAGLPCLVSDTVTRQAQCGLIKYKPLESGPANWAQTITEILEDKTELTLKPSALHNFSIQNMAEQWWKVVQMSGR